jgi:uncharacterized membrane protein YeaQ/YmgE (transglycosylase-associated protein family)
MDMLSLLWAGIVGLIAGAIARALSPGHAPGGWVVTMLIGIGGALLMTFIGRTLGWYSEGDRAGFIFSIVGALILLAVWRVIERNRG